VPSMGDNNPPELMIPERLVPFDESEPQSSGRALSAELAQDAPDVRRVVTVAKRLWQFTKWMGQTTLSLGARVILEENAIPYGICSGSLSVWSSIGSARCFLICPCCEIQRGSRGCKRCGHVRGDRLPSGF
jgi:hypothetical protein